MTQSTHVLSTRQPLLLLFIVVSFALLPVFNAQAVSMGPYVDVSSGSGAYQWDSSAVDIDIDMRTSGLGFVLDTAAADESFFNYRLNVGIEGQRIDENTAVQATTDVNGLSVENVFGFAIKSAPGFRWWAGPLLRFGFYHGESDTYYLLGRPYKTELNLVESSIGVVTGVNIKVGDNMTLSPSVGVRSIAAGGSVAIVNQNTDAVLIDEGLTGHSSTLFLNFALLF